MGEREKPATRWQAVASIFSVIGGGEYSFAISLILVYGFLGPAFMLGLAAAVFILRSYVGPLWECAKPKYGFSTKIEGYVNFSTPDYIAAIYGKVPSLLVTVFAVLAISSLLMLQYVLGATLISSVSGWGYEISVAFIVLLVALYVIIGSFTALLHTDFVQGLLMWAALFVVVVFVYLFQDLGVAHLESVKNLTEKTVGSLRSINEDPTIFTMFFITAIAAFSGPDIWQRVCIVKDPGDSRLALRNSGFAFILFLIPLTLIAIDVQSSGVAGSVDPFRNYIDLKMSANDVASWPIWLSAIFAGGLLSAFVSSADTFALLLSSLVQNEYRRWYPKKSETLSRNHTNALVALFSVFGGVIAMAEPGIPEQFAAVLSLLSVIGATVLFSLNNKGNRNTAIFAIGLGGIIALGQAYIVPHYSEGYWVFLPLLPSLAHFFATPKDAKFCIQKETRKA
ncbi:hypothetical protein L0E83_07730 [Marichromatium gracile]|uniref:sodium:solute symporter family transporter n=1 Tax=Marichromatium gracile TaxID=1048 RepID=UPI001F372C6A|nr:hypothetical protein [Marichromatium gracile]MCF1183326.1 hypothetical protein [Marichromatium gracile]